MFVPRLAMAGTRPDSDTRAAHYELAILAQTRRSLKTLFAQQFATMVCALIGCVITSKTRCRSSDQDSAKAIAAAT